eukprot:6351054-Amphidinium_carterae.1
MRMNPKAVDCEAEVLAQLDEHAHGELDYQVATNKLAEVSAPNLKCNIPPKTFVGSDSIIKT